MSTSGKYGNGNEGTGTGYVSPTSLNYRLESLWHGTATCSRNRDTAEHQPLQLVVQLQLLPRQRHPASSRTGRSWVWFGHGTDLGLQRYLQQVPRELSSFENPLWLWGLRFGRNILTILYILAVSSSTSMVVYLLAAVEILEILDFCVIMS